MGFTTKAARGIRAVDLSADDAFQFDRLAAALLDDALFEFDHFVTVDRRRVDPAHWKPWRQDDDVVVFRERHASDAALVDTSDDAGHAHHRRVAAANTTGTPTTASGYGSGRKPMPRLLAVGSLACALDDVLFGLVTPSAAAMRLQAASLENDDFLDGAVLASIRAPTSSEPFQFLGLKWLLQRGQGGLGLARPRDYVFLEASGVQIRQDGSGQRVGFHVLHSVDLPECEAPADARGASVQRGAFSACYLYHELANGAVDVYMTALVEPRGSLIAPLAMRAAAAAMLPSNWRALALFAETKKLAWLLQTHRQLHAGAAAAAPPLAKRCGLCSKSLKGFAKKRLACQLCAMTVCAHCSMARTLRAEGFARRSIVATAMLFCKKCVALTGEESAGEIARQQLWEDDVVRTGRAHTQTALALARRDPTVHGSRLLHHRRSFSMERDVSDAGSTAGPLTAYHDHLRSTWHDTDPGARRAPLVYDSAPTKASVGGGSTRRHTNGTWNGSVRATETLSLGAMDFRASSYQEPAPEDDASGDRENEDDNDDDEDAGRASAVSSALVLLDDRKSSRRMKALDYLPTEPQAVAMAPPGTTRVDECMSFASSSMFTEAEDTESEYSHASMTSSIAVLGADPQQQQQRHESFGSQAKPLTITEEEEPPSSLSEFYQQQYPRPTHPPQQPYEHQPPPRSQHEYRYLQQPTHQQQQQQQQRQQQYQEPRRAAMVRQRHSFQQHLQGHQPRAPQPERRSSRVRFEDPHHVSHHVSHHRLLQHAHAHETDATAQSDILPPRSSMALSSSHDSEAAASSEAGGEQRLSYQMQLWLQMNELRDTAESTYQITQRNAEAIATQNPQLYRNMRFFSQAPLGGHRRPSVPAMRQTPMSAAPAMGREPGQQPTHRRYTSAVPMSPMSH